MFADQIRQQETLLEKTKQKQITLIKCTKGVINSGERLAEAITSYYNTSVTHPYHGLSLSANKNTIDAQQLTKFQEEWEKHITDESLLSELEEALEKENYNAMTKLQLQYTRASDTDGEDTDGLVSVELLIQKVESTYSEIFLPEDTLEKNPEELKPIIESTVNFAVALNSFHEAIRSTHDEGFDLTNVILISLKHPAIIKATDLWGEAYVKLIEATEDLY